MRCVKGPNFGPFSFAKTGAKPVSYTHLDVYKRQERFGIRGRDLSDKHAKFIEFSAKTRMSGVDLDGEEIRKGAADAVKAYVCLLYTSRCV